MLIHVYEVTKLHVVDAPMTDGFATLEEVMTTAIKMVQEGKTSGVDPECKLVAIHPGGQETTNKGE